MVALQMFVVALVVPDLKKDGQKLDIGVRGVVAGDVVRHLVAHTMSQQ